MKLIQLKDITFKQFISFLDSLDEENKTWSLDLQNYKDKREFYKNEGEWCFVGIDKDKMISMINAYGWEDEGLALISFVVKKEYQGNGIGTEMLKFIENELKKIDYNGMSAKHYQDNIASHKAFLKAGWVSSHKNNNGEVIVGKKLK